MKASPNIRSTASSRGRSGTRSQILAEDGAGPQHVVRMTCYVTDRHEYVNSRDEIGVAWKEIMGPNYPAMALVEVKGLVESAAKVEIETTAVVEE